MECTTNFGDGNCFLCKFSRKLEFVNIIKINREYLNHFSNCFS